MQKKIHFTTTLIMLPATDLGNQLEADHEKTQTIVRSGPWAGFEGTEPPSVSQETPAVVVGDVGDVGVVGVVGCLCSISVSAGYTEPSPSPAVSDMDIGWLVTGAWA